MRTTREPNVRVGAPASLIRQVFFGLGLLLVAGCAAPQRTLPEPDPTPAPHSQLPPLVQEGLHEPMAASLHLPVSPAVRVGIAVRQARLRLQLEGTYALHVMGAEPVRLDTPDWQFRPDAGGILCTGDGRRYVAPASMVLQPLSSSSRLRFGEHAYRGHFEIREIGGGLSLINELDLEDYLRGVVPWEIGWHDAQRRSAVEAQAIAARTYAYKRLGQYPEEGFDLYASVQDQVYRGTTREDPTANEAIDNTRGQVLWASGELVDAYYSSTCGGYTSRIERVWRGKPARSYLQGRRDAAEGDEVSFCRPSRHFRWTETWSGSQLEKVLQETLPPELGLSSRSVMGGLLDLSVVERNFSGRVARMEIVMTSGRYVVHGDRVRWVLRPKGRTILRSALIDIQVEKNPSGYIRQVTVRGGGNGHGVGMCQMGALEMARAGYGSQRILGHYYPSTAVLRVYE